MARLVVEALAFDWSYPEESSTYERVRISVAVSDATTGAPVTGLTKDHFTVKYIAGGQTMVVAEVTGATQTGFYLVTIHGFDSPTAQTSHYGVAVSAPAGKGQTLVEVVTSPNP